MSLLEAVGYGTRVIVSDIPENVDCMEGYGNSFERGNVESLRKLLQFCLDNEELRDCDFKNGISSDEVGKKRIELMERYDWDNITEQTLDLYRTVAGK